MIKVYYNPDHSLHNPEYELYDGLKTDYAEKPDRIRSIISGLETIGLSPVAIKNDIPHKLLTKVHNEKYVSFIKNKSIAVNDQPQIIPSYYIMDTYTPITRHTYNVAIHSAGLAVFGAKKLLESPTDIIYALCRPPGHHAEQKAMGGYCYFNNAALAAEYLSSEGKVSILDIDFHHGNGTQEYFYSRSDVQYISLHADPNSSFPYLTGFSEEKGIDEGIGTNLNFPLNTSIDGKAYIKILKKAIAELNKFDPAFVVLSLGFDTYEGDPIAGMGLSEDIYFEIGTMIRDISRPILLIQEGGYNVEKLGIISSNFIKGVGYKD